MPPYLAIAIAPGSTLNSQYNMSHNAFLFAKYFEYVFFATSITTVVNATYSRGDRLKMAGDDHSRISIGQRPNLNSPN